MEQEGHVSLNPQKNTRSHLRHLTIEFPHLDCLTFQTSGHISFVGSVNSVKDFSVGNGPLQLHVFRVRPQQRHRGVGWTTKTEVGRGEIRTIPDLFRNQSNALRKILECAQKGTGVSSGGDFIVATLTAQQRPWAPLSPTVIARTVFSLPESVVVVTTPTWSMWRVNFDDGINDAQRILNDWIVCAANTVTDQFEKTRIDDLFSGKFNARARGSIRQYQRAAIWVLIRTVDRAGRIHAHVVPCYAGH